MKKYKIKIILLIFITLGLKLNAQNDTTTNVNLEKIVIEASKNGLTEKNSPLMVSVINQQKNENLKINDLGDLNIRIPNFFMQSHGSRLTSPIYIRGIGSRINSSAVGLYVDGIPYFDMGSFNFEMFDIKRIEVLRGPQGTLYGRNTMGGLINIISAQAVDKQEFSLYSLYGNYNRMKTVFHYNQPISSKFFMLFDGSYAHSDGFFVNKFLGKSADLYNTYSGKIKFKYNVSKKLKANFVLSYEKNLQNGYPYGLYDTTNQELSDVYYDQLSTYNRNMISSGLKIVYSANNFILKNSTSFQFIVDEQKIDQDFTALNLLFVNQKRKINTYVEELSIKSKKDSKVNWISGIFAFKNIQDKNVSVFYNEDAVTMFHLPGEMRKEKTYNQPQEGIAAYGQFGYQFKKLNITAGIRADYEKDFLNYIYNLYMSDAEYPKANLDTTNQYFEILPKINFSYNLSKQIFTYFTISKGYKAGGFNSTFERSEDISFNPEYSYNYEVGLKTFLFNQKLNIKASAFYIDWLNQQVYQPVPSGQGAMLKNAGHSMSKGGELEITAFPTNNLQIWIYTGYNDVKYLKYIKDETTDYSGNKIPYIPEYTGNLGFNYSLIFYNSILNSISLTADYQLIGKFYWNDQNTAFQKTYGLFNANIAFNTKRLVLGISAKNLFNSNYNTFYFEALGNSYAQKGNPLEVSSFIKIKF